MGSSTLACVGLEVTEPGELIRLLQDAGCTAQPAGTFDGVSVMRWQDPSGAALVIGGRDGRVEDLVATYASTAGGMLADCRLVSDCLASAAVVDNDGEQLTAMTFEAEQYRQIKAIGQPVAGPARITALGVSVNVHADAAAYSASPDSLAGPLADPGEYLRRGWGTPPRMAAESFISYGAFAQALGNSAPPTAQAWLSGTVLRASHRTCALTGQGFSVATVRTAGFAADVCLPDLDHLVPPEPGNIISGTVFLAAAFEPENPDAHSYV